jgi:hypothetical protein
MRWQTRSQSSRRTWSISHVKIKGRSGSIYKPDHYFEAIAAGGVLKQDEDRFPLAPIERSGAEIRTWIEVPLFGFIGVAR